MDPLEEQAQELEILESIYPDELTIHSPTRFTITILLDVESKKKHAIGLDVVYPPEYPEMVPELDVVEGELITEDSEEEDFESEEEDSENEDEYNQAGSKKLLNLIETVYLDKSDYQTLLRKLKEEAEENVGMPSVFSLTSSLKDQAETIFQEKFKDKEKKILQEREAKEREEHKKFTGTTVTSESFSNWRNTFRKEMGIDKRLSERYASVHQGRLTGKEIFEKGLASGEEAIADVEDGNDADVNAIKKSLESTSI